MNRKNIPIQVERRLYCESMGKCMNPNCKKDFLYPQGDICEKAHIDAYCNSRDNTFDNLVILCTECHKKFDKLHLFTEKEVANWKILRKNELDLFFQTKYRSFSELKDVIRPLLLENKAIFENYFINDKRELWDDFENKIISNNNIIKNLIKTNIMLFQYSKIEEKSNQEIINKFLQHIDEFAITRNNKEKDRSILFPKEIDSIFCIEPLLTKRMEPYLESIEKLISKLQSNDTFGDICLGIGNPYLLLKNGKKIYLNDTPYIRQLLYTENCFVQSNFKFESLNFILKYLTNNQIKFTFPSKHKLNIINVKSYTILFVYEYCLTAAYIKSLAPKSGTIIVNLHNWNGELSISEDAYDIAKSMDVSLYTVGHFYGFIRK